MICEDCYKTKTSSITNNSLVEKVELLERILHSKKYFEAKVYHKRSWQPIKILISTDERNATCFGLRSIMELKKLRDEIDKFIKTATV